MIPNSLSQNGRFLLLLPLLLLLLATSLAQAQDPILPTAVPNASLGLEIYADANRCANCHGPAGQGDGELSARLDVPPADFTDPQFRRTRIPADMFTIITNGSIASAMPPFGPENMNDPISEANRWDLVAAVYSLATPPEELASGQIVYEANCAACHGESGAADGPDAADFDPPPTDLTSLAYWYNRSNQTVFDAIQNEAIPAHDYDLSEDDLWAVVDYTRAFSYRYLDPNAPFLVTISGVLTNGTSGAIVTEGQVLLRAFDENFQPSLTLTETVSAAGTYTFTLEDATPGWVYLASARYNDLSFSSEAIRLSRSEPDLALPIVVYDTTTDPTAVTIDQMHILLNFTSARVQVDEFYTFSNQAGAVFVGETGDSDDGTFRISLPAAAENVSFQRTMGSMETLIQAPEVIPVGDTWADTLPVQPGRSGMSLLVSYDMPYDGGVSLDRPIHFAVTNANVIMPVVDVSLEGEGFVSQGVQNMGGNEFIAYTNGGLAPGDTLVASLQGQPDFSGAAGGSAAVVPAQNQTLEMVIGGLALLVVGITAVLTIRTWRAHITYTDDEEADAEADVDQLLQAIADLDDAFEAGQIDEAAYTAQRAELKAALSDIWA